MPDDFSSFLESMPGRPRQGSSAFLAAVGVRAARPVISLTEVQSQRLLGALRQGPVSVQELCVQLGSPRPALEELLHSLHRLKLLERRFTGNEEVVDLSPFMQDALRLFTLKYEKMSV